MDIRAQVSMVFHLDKCIGCHTCSIACKNIWTDRKGAEYMWWNNVETKPGTGYPTLWEDQDKYQGGFEQNATTASSSACRARAPPSATSSPTRTCRPWTTTTSRGRTTTRSSSTHLRRRPADRAHGLDDHRRHDGRSRPARTGTTTSAVRRSTPRTTRTSRASRTRSAPSSTSSSAWSSSICPASATTASTRVALQRAPPARSTSAAKTASSCSTRTSAGPGGCASPAARTRRRTTTGRPASPRSASSATRALETGQAPACFHSCVGRIRYLGLLLYDASQIEKVAAVADEDLVEAQRGMIKDPFDPEVIAAAKANGLSDAQIVAAQESPVYKFVMQWKLALPLHPEFRTLPMLFYVPPMLPVIAEVKNGSYDVSGAERRQRVRQHRNALDLDASRRPACRSVTWRASSPAATRRSSRTSTAS